jgi:hypothetical protein
MDPPIATSAPGHPGLRVGPAPPPLRPGTLSATPHPAREIDPNCCNGRNACKGQGGCANDLHDCAGKNECKGLASACPPGSSAATDPQANPKDCCKGKNNCKGQSACKVPGRNACRGQNECKGKGWGCMPGF